MVGEFLEQVWRALIQLAPPGAWRVLALSVIPAAVALSGIGLRATEWLVGTLEARSVPDPCDASRP